MCIIKRKIVGIITSHTYSIYAEIVIFNSAASRVTALTVQLGVSLEYDPKGHIFNYKLICLL